MRTYFGVNYIAPIDILVPKEYESIGNDVKTAIENLNINTNLEVLDSAADVTERMNAGTYNIALTTMSDEGDASVFDNGQSVFHFENGDAQQLTPMPWPRPTTTIISPHARLRARRQRKRGQRLAVHTQELPCRFRWAAGVSEESDRPSAAVEQIDAALIFPRFFMWIFRDLPAIPAFGSIGADTTAVVTFAF